MSDNSPRGKDLKWRPVSMFRETANVLSAFRYVKQMSEALDDEFAEAEADVARELVRQADGNLTRILEVLKEVQEKQARKRKEAEGA